MTSEFPAQRASYTEMFPFDDVILSEPLTRRRPSFDKRRPRQADQSAVPPLIYFDGLVQGRSKSSALAMELCLSCTNPSICGMFTGLLILNDIPPPPPPTHTHTHTHTHTGGPTGHDPYESQSTGNGSSL